MRKVKYYKCPECQKKFKTLGGWADHVDSIHPGLRPAGFSDARFFYQTLTGKSEGRCIECHSPTDWNEATGKYNRFCNNPNCKKAYVKIAKTRMVNKYGKEYLLNDPEMQKKMLLSKKISGYYEFSNGSGKLGYVGSYEKDFLQMMDQFMGYSASDIMSPSPHTYYYEYEGKQHFYIPDFYVPNLNLEIEIKTQDNKHPKIQAVDKVKEKLKDDVMVNNPKVNYIKINDKDYTTFFEYLLSLKNAIDETSLGKDAKNISEINQALEAFEYVDEETEEGFDYDPHLCALREGVLLSGIDSVVSITCRTVMYFIFHTTTSGTRQIGYTMGYDYFGSVICGVERIYPQHSEEFKLTRDKYALVPQLEGDDIVRTNSLYVKRIDGSPDGHIVSDSDKPEDDSIPFIIDPSDRENEYMIFAVSPPYGFEAIIDDLVSALNKLSRENIPLIYGWDRESYEWVNHQNKYHYYCYAIMHAIYKYKVLTKMRSQELMTASSVYFDNLDLDDMFHSEFTAADVCLIDRGFMAELNDDRIETAIKAFSYRMNESSNAFVREMTLEDTGYYKDMSPTLEKLLYKYTFSDIEPRNPDVFIEEPAMENIQLHTNFDTVKVKGSLDLSKFRKVTLTQEVLDKYKEKCASFGHCRISNMSRGYVWVDKSDKIVGFVNVVSKTDNIKWIQALNLQSEYQGYGLYEQLLKVAVRELGGTDVETPPKNDNAMEVYKKFGFKVYTDEQSRRCMSIRADAERSKYANKAKPNATTMEEAGLFPVYVILTNASKLEGNYSKLLTKESYAHVSVAFDSTMMTVYSFGTKDGHTMLPISTDAKSLMVKLKSDPDANYAIYVKLVSKKDYDTISNKVKSMYAQKGGFNFDMPSAVKSEMAKAGTNEKRYFCSSFIAYLLGSSEKIEDIPDIKNIYLVDMGLVKDYKQKFIDKKVSAIFEKHYMHKEKNSDKQPIDEKED